MTVVETKVNVKKENGAVVSADVHLYDDTGDVVKTVSIVESETLAELEETVEGFREGYVSQEALLSVLENNGEATTINATALRGLDSDEIALKSEIPTTFDPIAHDHVTNKYGLGSTSKYGHVKVRNDLQSAVFVTGEALSAYQGKVLNDRISSLQNVNTDASISVTSGKITANMNNISGEVYYSAVDFGSTVGVFLNVHGLYFTGSVNNSTYYHVSSELIPSAFRPNSDATFVVAGMGGCMRGINITTGGRVQLRRITNENNTYYNKVYCSVFYFKGK